MEAAAGNEILLSQALSNNAPKICVKKITPVKGELKIYNTIVQKLRT